MRCNPGRISRCINSEIINGPTVYYKDELKHSKIEIEAQLFLEQNHKMRVQKLDLNNNTVISETILGGPQYCTPQIDELYTKLKLYNVKNNEYIWIKYINGNMRIEEGPIMFYFDPLKHAEVSIKESMILECSFSGSKL